MENWLKYFEYNRDHRHEICWADNLSVEPAMRAPLIHSLQRFQVGESGEGHHLRKQAATTNNPAYLASIDLFIKEEQEHARLMAEVLRRLEARLLQRHWSDACFIFLRRLFGLNQQLLVLLMPEMIAKRFFQALHDGSKDPVLRAVFAQIIHDEEGHLAFHVEFLHSALADLSVLSRMAQRTVWRLLFRAACLVVMWDHRKILRAVGVSSAKFWWNCDLIFDEVSAGIFSWAPTPTRSGPIAASK